VQHLQLLLTSPIYSRNAPLHNLLAGRLLVLDVVLLSRVVRRAVLARLAGSNAVRLGFALPKVLLASDDALHPRRQESAGDAPRPGLLLFLVGGNDPAARGLLDDVDERVDDDVRADTGNQTVGDRVGEGHDGDGEECRDSVAHVLPVDVLGRLSHEGTDNDERTSGGPWRDRGENRREEDGDEEGETSEHRSETSLSSFRDTSTRLDVRSDRGAAKEGTDCYTHSINGVGDRRVFEILGALVDSSAVACHGVHGTCAVEDINVEEGDESKTELASVLRDVPFLDNEDLLDWVEGDDFLEEIERVVAEGSVGEVGNLSRAGPGDDRNEQDTEDDGALDTVQHQHNSQDTTTEDANPQCRIAHLVASRADTARILELVLASCKFEGSRYGAGDQTNTGRVRKANDGKVKSDSDTCRELDTSGDSSAQNKISVIPVESDVWRSGWRWGPSGTEPRRGAILAHKNLTPREIGRTRMSTYLASH
jgi:hypothetical protein